MHVMQSSATVFLIDQMEFHNRNTRARMHAEMYAQTRKLALGDARSPAGNLTDTVARRNDLQRRVMASSARCPLCRGESIASIKVYG